MSTREELKNIVGPEYIFDDPETLDAYSRDESFVRPVKPWIVIKPEDSEQIQSIVKWANNTATPLVPVSSGLPRFRGDTVPGVPGAVIVDLSRMKQIIKIDRRNKMVIIEPGVTWSELLPELAKEGLTLPMPLMPRRNKSVIGSLLEREPVLVPRYHWTMLEPLRCCEVIWGSGDRLWTGEAGDQRGTLEERWSQFMYQVNPMGPHQTDFYRFVSAAQGSMGIVTCASLKCEVLPQVHKLFFIHSEKLDDLIDFAYKVLRSRYGYELFVLNSMALAAIMGNSSGQIEELSVRLPRWTLILGIAGLQRLPHERVKVQEKDIKDMARQLGRELVSEVPGVDDGHLCQILGKPSADPYWKLRYKGGYHDIFFLTTLNRTPEFVDAMYSLSNEAGYTASDVGVYLQPVMQGVACHCEFILPFAPGDKQTLSKVQRLVSEGARALMEQGGFFSRPYGTWADMVYSSESQNTIALKKVKGIFDPNNVMNPGKLCF